MASFELFPGGAEGVAAFDPTHLARQAEQLAFHAVGVHASGFGARSTRLDEFAQGGGSPGALPPREGMRSVASAYR